MQVPKQQRRLISFSLWQPCSLDTKHFHITRYCWTMLMTLILNSHIFYDLIYVRYACIVFLMMMMMMMRMSIVEKI